MRSCVGVRVAAVLAMLCFPCPPVAAQVVPTPPSQERNARLAAIVLARPLFNPDRAPVPDATETAPLPRLTATLLGPFGNRAIFEIQDKAVTLVQGEHIGPWTVGAIAAGTATLTQPDHSRALVLAFAAPRPEEPQQQTAAADGYWSNPCGRSHARDPAGRAISLRPDLCQATGPGAEPEGSAPI